MQLWLARQQEAAMAQTSVQRAGLALLTGYDSLREVLALAYYWLRGWLC